MEMHFPSRKGGKEAARRQKWTENNLLKGEDEEEK